MIGILMRRLIIAAAAFIFPASLNAQQSILIDVDFNWSRSGNSKDFAEKLQSSGFLPRPLVFVDGQLVGVHPSAFPIEVRPEKFVIEMGIYQIADRPLYKISGRKDGDAVSVDFELARTGYAPNYKLPSGDTGAFTITGVDNSKGRFAEKDGVHSIVLDVYPYAPIVRQVEANPKTLSFNRIAPVVQISGAHQYEPIAIIAERQRAPLKNVEGAYYDFSWTQKVTTWFSQPFRIEPLDRIRIESTPNQATVTVNGMTVSQKTDAEFVVSKKDWARTVISREQYVDCPIDEKKIDTSVNPPKFKCALKKKR